MGYEPGLHSYDANGVFAESYAYDALGRRVRTTNLEGTTRHVYDDGWQVIADVAEDGAVLRSYVWGEGVDRLLAVKVGDRAFTALTDVQGTVWGYADERGEVVARWTYDAWGNVLDEEVAASAAELRAIRYRFQGREFSAATGFTNFRMRWYDSVTGRWLSKDLIGLSGGLNLYAFCKNEPINSIDRFGLCKEDEDGSQNWLNNALTALWEAFKTAAGPAGTGEAAGALGTVPNLTTVLGMKDEMDKAMNILETEGSGDTKNGSEALDNYEKKFRKWSKAALNQVEKGD